MRPGAHLRGLDELHRLAGTLFDVLRTEFAVPASVPLDLARVDGLADPRVRQDQLVATVLLCTQMLHHETVRPAQSRRRHVVSLCDTIDQVLAALLAEREDESPASLRVREAHDRICRIGFSLAVLGEPGAPGWDG
jgi:hypothetical protein